MGAHKEIKAIQLALHLQGDDDGLDDALGYNLDGWHQAFVSAAIEGKNGLDAVHSADVAFGKRPRSDNAAKKKGSLLLNGRKGVKGRISNEVCRAIEHRRRKAAIEAGVTEAEFYSGVRALLRIGLGQEKVNKTLVASHQGDIFTLDGEFYETNLTAAGKAVEMMGKALGQFVDRTELTGKGGVPLELSETERAARVASILEAARNRQADADAEANGT